MTKEEMIKRYDYLYDLMKNSQEVKNMKLFGKAEKYMFYELASAHPELAERWLSHLEGVEWKNYLSQGEAMNIGKRIINQDGTKGFHWNHDTFIGTVKTLGGVPEHKPYYNNYALCVTANMIYSDHAKSISEDMGYRTQNEVPNEKMALSCYKKAVENLTDEDNGFMVRDYFRHKMYNDSPMVN